MNTFGYLLFDYIIMSVIDTYTKYNLHSATPYIEGENVRVCKKQGGTCGRENVRGEHVQEEMSYIEQYIQHIRKCNSYE